MQEVRWYIYTSLRGQVRARVITTLSHNNVLGQCRDNLTIYLRVKYNAKFTLNAEIVAYNALVLAYKYTTPIRDNII